jgi:hypothetical protein
VEIFLEINFFGSSIAVLAFTSPSQIDVTQKFYTNLVCTGLYVSVILFDLYKLTE